MDWDKQADRRTEKERSQIGDTDRQTHQWAPVGRGCNVLTQNAERCVESLHLTDSGGLMPNRRDWLPVEVPQPQNVAASKLWEGRFLGRETFWVHVSGVEVDVGTISGKISLSSVTAPGTSWGLWI